MEFCRTYWWKNVADETVSFKVIRDQWVLLSPINRGQGSIDDWVIRANKFGKPRVVPDTGRDKTQEIFCSGFVRARPKREFDLTKFKPS